MPCPESFFDAYVTTALWSSNDESTPEGGEPFDANYSASDLAPGALAAMRADCDLFYDQNRAALECEGVTYGPDFDQDGRAGHDFWLTRNGHGAGFWDGDWPEPQATDLTEAAREFNQCDLYLGDDGLIYVM